MKKIIILISLLMFGCEWYLPNAPDPESFRQDKLYCWLKNKDTNTWYVLGLRNRCPEGTYYDENSPN